MKNTFLNLLIFYKENAHIVKMKKKLHRKINENGEAEEGDELTNYIGNINSGEQYYLNK
ncbi:MAG: hypothetical protein IPL53_22090 [Ignavibacteria bacterium]|nr:hypothetical protein [Ignavibacteria bacterium]